MRTVTFSDPRIVKLISDSFVCAWVNKKPDKRFDDYPISPVLQGLSVGAAVPNVTSVFCAADGTVIHAIPGFLDSPSLETHIQFARGLHARLYDPAVKAGERFGIRAEALLTAASAARNSVVRHALQLQANRWMWAEVMPLTFFDRVPPGGGCGFR